MDAVSLWSPLDWRLADRMKGLGLATADAHAPFVPALADVAAQELGRFAWEPARVVDGERPHLLVVAESGLDTTSCGLLFWEAWERRGRELAEPRWRAVWTDGPLVRLDVVAERDGTLFSGRLEIRHRPH